MSKMARMQGGLSSQASCSEKQQTLGSCSVHRRLNRQRPISSGLHWKARCDHHPRRQHSYKVQLDSRTWSCHMYTQLGFLGMKQSEVPYAHAFWQTERILLQEVELRVKTGMWRHSCLWICNSAHKCELCSFVCLFAFPLQISPLQLFPLSCCSPLDIQPLLNRTTEDSRVKIILLFQPRN